MRNKWNRDFLHILIWYVPRHITFTVVNAFVLMEEDVSERQIPICDYLPKSDVLKGEAHICDGYDGGNNFIQNIRIYII